MNFTADMIQRLNPEERLLLKTLYDKTQDKRPEPLQPDWPWTMKGPAPEEYAIRVRKGVPSPRLTGGTTTAAELVRLALASEADRA